MTISEKRKEQKARYAAMTVAELRESLTDYHLEDSARRDAALALGSRGEEAADAISDLWELVVNENSPASLQRVCRFAILQIDEEMGMVAQRMAEQVTLANWSEELVPIKQFYAQLDSKKKANKELLQVRDALWKVVTDHDKQDEVRHTALDIYRDQYRSDIVSRIKEEIGRISEDADGDFWLEVIVRLDRQQLFAEDAVRNEMREGIWQALLAMDKHGIVDAKAGLFDIYVSWEPESSASGLEKLLHAQKLSERSRYELAFRRGNLTTIQTLWEQDPEWSRLRPLIWRNLLGTLSFADLPEETMLAALNWVTQNSDNFAQETSSEAGKRFARLTTILRKIPENGYSWEVDNKAVDTSQQLLARRMESAGVLLKTLTNGETTETAKIDAIRELANLPSNQTMRDFLKVWQGWIASGANGQLVELAAQEMLDNPYAILPLSEIVGQQVAQQKMARHAAATGQASMLAQSGPPLLQRRVVKLLADMSQERLFGDDRERFDEMVANMKAHVVPVFAGAITDEEDIEIREGMAHVLGNAGGADGVDILVRVIVGGERRRKEREQLLKQYYLDPSNWRSDEASRILERAVKQSERTLHILQILNISLFVAGLFIIVAGVLLGFTGEGTATRVAGALSALGGFTGVLVQLVRNPMARIQNSMGRLVQMVTAFTGYIWKLNLNGTFIQSRYVAAGILTTEEVSSTLERIQHNTEATLNMVARYTMEAETSLDKQEPQEFVNDIPEAVRAAANGQVQSQPEQQP